MNKFVHLEGCQKSENSTPNRRYHDDWIMKMGLRIQ